MISYMCDSVRNISNFFRKCFEMNGVRKAISPLKVKFHVQQKIRSSIFITN